MIDTSPDARRVHLDAIRRLTPSERVAQALAFSESMRQLSLATLRVRYPERSQLQLVELLLGVSLETANAGRAPVR